ncbi:MAG: glycosyltransferase [Micrococcales bacterium]|nr:MAG: glycosyltransferase [Micrococcales bacterium]
MHDALLTVFDVIGTPVLIYFVLINTSYLVLIAVATLDFARHLRRMPYSGLDEVASSPLTQPVSIVMAAHREEVGIIVAVRAMLALRYPEYELIVVVDGDPDPTLDVLAEEFDLVPCPFTVTTDVPVRVRPTHLFVPRDGRTALRVLVKQNSGRSDSLNVGINLARYPLVALVDADSVLDPDALLVVSKPFADDPQRTVATGGVIRALNGCQVLGGRVVQTAMPPNWIGRIQVVEYLRAFMLGRTGWSRLGCLVLISGAFGLFRRDLLVQVGGLDPDTIGEDFDLVMRIHHHMRPRRVDYRVSYLAEPVLWTEMPPTFAVLGRQRRRWHRGLWEVLWAHRRMLANPRYGRIGLVAVPYYWVFELFAPLLELTGAVLILLGFLFAAVDTWYALMFLAVAYAYGTLVSIAAILAEEFSFHRYRRWRDLWLVLAAAVLENLGYRQLTAWWRIRGWLQGLARTKQQWGRMIRLGVLDQLDLATAQDDGTRRPDEAASAPANRPVGGDRVSGS